MMHTRLSAAAPAEYHSNAALAGVSSASDCIDAMAWKSGPPKAVKEPPASQQTHSQHPHQSKTPHSQYQITSMPLGSVVRVQLHNTASVNGQNSGVTVIDGTVFAHDAASGVTVLTQPDSKPHASIARIVHTASVRSVNKIQQAPDGFGTEALPTADPNAMRARINANVKSMHDEAASVNERVSSSVQDLFDSLSRLYPRDMRWDGEHMIAFDAIRIVPPYTEHDCHPETHGVNDAMLTQLRKQLAARSRQLQQNSNTNSNSN